MSAKVSSPEKLLVDQKPRKIVLYTDLCEIFKVNILDFIWKNNANLTISGKSSQSHSKRRH